MIPDPPTAAPPGKTDAQTDALSLADAVELILARRERETCEFVATGTAALSPGRLRQPRPVRARRGVEGQGRLGLGLR